MVTNINSFISELANQVQYAKLSGQKSVFFNNMNFGKNKNFDDIRSYCEARNWCVSITKSGNTVDVVVQWQ